MPAPVFCCASAHMYAFADQSWLEGVQLSCQTNGTQTNGTPLLAGAEYKLWPWRRRRAAARRSCALASGDLGVGESRQPRRCCGIETCLTRSTTTLSKSFSAVTEVPQQPKERADAVRARPCWAQRRTCCSMAVGRAALGPFGRAPLSSLGHAPLSPFCLPRAQCLSQSEITVLVPARCMFHIGRSSFTFSFVGTGPCWATALGPCTRDVVNSQKMRIVLSDRERERGRGGEREGEGGRKRAAEGGREKYEREREIEREKVSERARE